MEREKMHHLVRWEKKKVDLREQGRRPMGLRIVDHECPLIRAAWKAVVASAHMVIQAKPSQANPVTVLGFCIIPMASCVVALFRASSPSLAPTRQGACTHETFFL